MRITFALVCLLSGMVVICSSLIIKKTFSLLLQPNILHILTVYAHLVTHECKKSVSISLTLLWYHMDTSIKTTSWERLDLSAMSEKNQKKNILMVLTSQYKGWDFTFNSCQGFLSPCQNMDYVNNNNNSNTINVLVPATSVAEKTFLITNVNHSSTKLKRNMHT